MDWLALLRAIAALAVTVGLLVGAAALARRFGLLQTVGRTASSRLQVVEQLWLDPGRTRATVLRWDDEEHLVVMTPTATVVLAAKPRPPGDAA